MMRKRLPQKTEEKEPNYSLLLGLLALLGVVVTALLGNWDKLTGTKNPTQTPAKAPAGASTQAAQSATGNSNIQITGTGNTVTLSDVMSPDSRGGLKIVKVRYEQESQLDFLVKNTSNSDIVIHEIRITNINPPPPPGAMRVCMKPALRPTAKYSYDTDSILEGKSGSISASHVIYARTVDRFLVALNRHCLTRLRIDLLYDAGGVVSFIEEK